MEDEGSVFGWEVLQGSNSRSLYSISGVRVVRSLVFSVTFCRSLFVLLSFIYLATVLSVLRPTVFDYPFYAFNLYHITHLQNEWGTRSFPVGQVCKKLYWCFQIQSRLTVWRVSVKQNLAPNNVSRSLTRGHIRQTKSMIPLTDPIFLKVKSVDISCFRLREYESL